MLKTTGVFVLTRGATIMAQSINDNVTTSSLLQTQKQQKKQAKRESMLRLEVEQARGDVQKVERTGMKLGYHHGACTEWAEKGAGLSIS
jgi:hypothetical protein